MDAFDVTNIGLTLGIASVVLMYVYVSAVFGLGGCP